MKKIICLFLIFGLVGCGTISSLDSKNAVQYALIKISDSFEITGRLLEETDSKLVVAIDGVKEEYKKSEIVSYEIIMLPSENAMLEDVVINSSRTTSHLATLLMFTILAVIIAISASGK